MKPLYYLVITVMLCAYGCKKDEGASNRNTSSESNSTTTIPCGHISTNTELTPGVYIIDCQVDVTDNAVLKIDPGVTIKFSGNGEMSTSNGGAIDAEGTSALPITFTGIQQTAGFWYGIDIFTNSTSNIFKYCQFKYGGKDGGNGVRSMVYVGDGTSTNLGRASFQNCTFSNGLKNGLYLAPNSFLDNSSNNTFTANAQYPVSTALEAVSQFSANNTYSGNGSDYIYINSDYQCYANVHLPKLDVPYYLTASSNNKIQIYGNWTIDPGVTVAMGSNMELEVTTESGHTGSFNCIGRSTDFIIIKGFQSSQGFWDKIRFNGTTSGDNQIQYTIVKDGGSYADNIWGDNGMITIINTVYGGNHLTISNCDISNSLHYGIYVSSPSLENIDGMTGQTAIKNALRPSRTIGTLFFPSPNGLSYSNCVGANYSVN